MKPPQTRSSISYESRADNLASKYHREPPGEPLLSDLPSQENLDVQSSRNHCSHDPRSLRSPELPTLHQNTTGSLRESRFFPSYPVSPNKPDCQSGLLVDPIAPIRQVVKRPNSESRKPYWLGQAKGASRPHPKGGGRELLLTLPGHTRFPCPDLSRFPSFTFFASLSWCRFNDSLKYNVTCCTGSNTPNHRTRGPTPPNTLSACNSSAEWDLTLSHHYTSSTAYVEGSLVRMRESRLDITWELDRSNGYSENQSILLSPVGSIGPDSCLFEPALL
ncbi:hypothetical protein CRG98_013271 [Punica granatum]|uniref:Uncharacterized protein n=1 Tax=Punica granatum TaxID=22663 RepID=A0A2I0KCQ2_PUNGR|nr:hypothetical protein CRG98_013271 [Punica granatum]